MRVSAAPADLVRLRAGWLKSARFDLNLIGTVALVALASGIAATYRPELFPLILFLDLWLLGYHHVVSTFTRLCFDRDSFREHRFLVIELPLIVITVTIAATSVFGMWILATTYLYWQWFHYTRQSYGIERMYRRQAPEGVHIHDFLTTRSLYLLPVFGILYRSWQQPEKFLGMEVAFLPVSDLALWIAGALAVLTGAGWLAHSLASLARGQLALAHFLYVMSHHLIFLTGYCLIDDITTGWLVLNVWHNAQYILFVWWANNRRFSRGIDERAKFLSTLSQSRHVLAYMLVCLAIASALFFGLRAIGTGYTLADAVSVALVVSMVLNFHHYIVDGVIWKRRKAASVPTAG